jgi:hypothetical protein
MELPQGGGYPASPSAGGGRGDGGRGSAVPGMPSTGWGKVCHFVSATAHSWPFCVASFCCQPPLSCQPRGWRPGPASQKASFAKAHLNN